MSPWPPVLIYLLSKDFPPRTLPELPHIIKSFFFPHVPRKGSVPHVPRCRLRF